LYLGDQPLTPLKHLLYSRAGVDRPVGKSVLTSSLPLLIVPGSSVQSTAGECPRSARNDNNNLFNSQEAENHKQKEIHRNINQ